MEIFQLHRDRVNSKSFTVFEALDNDTSETGDYFKEKSNDVSPGFLVKLRDNRSGNEGRTLLHNAARKGSLAIVLHLIRCGHEIDVIDSFVSKITPLMDAISNGHIEIAIVLIEAGASILCQDINRENCIHYVSRTGNCRMLRNLISSSSAALSRLRIMELASSLNIKKKLPEQVAANSMMEEILEGLQLRGSHGLIFGDANVNQFSYSFITY